MYKDIILAIIASGTLSTLISGIIGVLSNAINKQKKSDGPVEQALMALSRERIKDRCNYHIANGSISSDELDDILALHAAYHRLVVSMGLENGYCDAVIAKIKGLPIRK